MPGAVPSSPHATATMRANRGKDTRPELALRASLHSRGLRFYKDRRLVLQPDRKVRPDIVFPRLRLAVFVDGCFWHGCGAPHDPGEQCRVLDRKDRGYARTGCATDRMARGGGLRGRCSEFGSMTLRQTLPVV